MSAIGGYFELELPQRSCYHRDVIALNTGRNCLEYILRVRNYNHVYIPYYTCEVILEPFKKLAIDYSFYKINLSLEIEDNIDLSDGEALLVTNYYGLKQDYITSLAEKYAQQLIVDNSQAFYATPISGIDTFYSCRKFFGVPDGAYLYCDKQLDMVLEQDVSWNRMDYLAKRIDLSAEDGYFDFKNQSNKLIGQPIRRMSSLTERIMSSINYKLVAQRRRDNYLILHKSLKSSNRLNLPLDNVSVPMVYPYINNDMLLRKRLIQEKIYIAQYWPNVFSWVQKDYTEYFLTSHIFPLPIDQRYGKDEMERILDLLC